MSRTVRCGLGFEKKLNSGMKVVMPVGDKIMGIEVKWLEGVFSNHSIEKF